MNYIYEPNGDHAHAPYIQAEFINPVDVTQSVNCKALLDTGADCTMVPLRVLDQINVQTTGRFASFIGFASDEKCAPYIISVKIDAHSFSQTEVWGWKNNFVLIGRDLLNQCCVEFDGPKLVFSFR